MANKPNPFQNKSCLVTGAAGFVGGYLVQMLLERGAVVVATDIVSAPPATANVPNAIYVARDITLSEEVESLFSWSGYDFIFHLASACGEGESEARMRHVNVLGSLNLIRAVAMSGSDPRRFVYWSAGGVYDFARGKRGTAAKETTPISPKLNPYLRTKYEAESSLFKEAAALGISMTSLRPGRVYGPGCKRGITSAIIKAPETGFYPFYAGPVTTRTGTVHVEDVCRAAMFVACHSQGGGQTFNVCDDSSYATAELLRKCSAHLGHPFIPGVAFPISALRWLSKRAAKQTGEAGCESASSEDMVELRDTDAMLDAVKLKSLGWTPKHPDALTGLLNALEPYKQGNWS